MKNSLATAVIIVVILAAAGIYFYSKTASLQPNQVNTGNCIKAGQTIPDGGSCCPNLARIFVAYYTPVKSCEELSRISLAEGSVYYICSACGNKNCESWENRCNCPQDCHYP